MLAQLSVLITRSLWVAVAYADTLPRGANPRDASLYQRLDGSFACRSSNQDGDVFDFDSVNDDYCDCNDGSDEPGTNACARGRFYCINQGSVPQTIPTILVDDGVCDCCDGSDEVDASSICPTASCAAEA
eukprot:3581491-Amphidinium_carterae.1